ncbi:MAG: hypothetical protein D6718_00200 [Acidobacteria bacterium]|nr:MAG: hypothetical protein D6718_00200 [Acidobacteriota bacterium]
MIGIRKADSGPRPSAGAGEKKRGARRGFDLHRHGVRLMIALVAVLLLDAAFWAMAVRPRQARIAELVELKADADKNEASALKRLEALRGVHEHVQGVREAVRRVFEEELATKRDRMVSFQRALTAVGRKYHVVPRRVSVGLQALETEGIEVLGFSFPLSGGYENLIRFLADLERLDQFLIVREVSLTGSSRGGRELQLNVLVETYFNAPEMKSEMERARRWRELQRKRKAARRRR